MNTEQILKVLKNERECIARQSRPLGEMPQCRKDDDGVKLCEYCDLCLPDDEILEVYDHLIRLCENKAIIIADISEEDKAKIIKSLSEAGYGIHPDVRATLVESVDEYGREHFKGICPYTGKKCGHWTCGICEVEARERKFMEGDSD